MSKSFYTNLYGENAPLLKLLTVILFLAFALPGLAQHYFVDESNGLKYQLDDEKHTAELIAQFYWPSSLYTAEKYVIPSSVVADGASYAVTKLGTDCFSLAENLQEVTVPATVEEIGEGCFSYSRALRVVHLSEGLKKIGTECFKSCTSLEQLVIPASVTEIGELLFSLAEDNPQMTITCLSSIPVEIKGDVSTYSAFYAHHKLLVPSGSEEAYKRHPIWGKFFMTDYTDSATGLKYSLNATTKTAILVCNVDAKGKNLYTDTKYDLPSTVKDDNGEEYVLTELGAHCFAGYANSYSGDKPNRTLQSVILPSTVKKLGGNCFAYCLGLKEVQLPEQLEELSTACFTCCNSLKEITFPQGLTKIGRGCFFGCSSLQSVQLPAGISVMESNSFACCSSLSNVVLSENCETLEESCFYYCLNLKEIIIPSKVKAIYNAFDGGTPLQKLVCNAIVPPATHGLGRWKLYKDCKLQVPEGCEDKYRGSEGWEKFYHTYVIGQDDGLWYDLDPMTQMGVIRPLEDAAKSKESYVIPAQVMEGNVTYTITEMDAQCFNGAENLKSISLPAAMEKLPEACFSSCSSLNSVRLPAGLKALGRGCFYECTSLKEITLPQTLETIEELCFQCNSGGLETVTIPASIKEIQASAFGGAINSIYCEGMEPIQAKDILNSSNGEASPLYGTVTLYVPVGCIGKYKASEEWGRFANIKEFVPSAIKGVVVNENKGDSATIYTLDGKNVGTNLQALPKGIYVQGGKKIVVRWSSIVNYL